MPIFGILELSQFITCPLTLLHGGHTLLHGGHTLLHVGLVHVRRLEI